MTSKSSATFDALQQVFGHDAPSPSNLRTTIHDVHGAAKAGGLALLDVGGSALRSYARANSLSMKGQPADIALRIREHFILQEAQKKNVTFGARRSGLCADATKDQSARRLERRFQLLPKQDDATLLFLRRAHEMNTASLVRLPSGSNPAHGFRMLGAAKSSDVCEYRCGLDQSCDAYTWYESDAPEPWANACIGQNLTRTGWSPMIDLWAHSAVKLWLPKRGHIDGNAAISKDVRRPTWRERCSRRMQVHFGALHTEVFTHHDRLHGHVSKPGDCHRSCERSSRCGGSIWMNPTEGAALLKHACFHMPPNKGTLPNLVASRRVSSAQKTRFMPTWDNPYALFAHHSLDGKLQSEVEQAAARVNRKATVALLTVHEEDIPSVRRFLCAISRWSSSKHPPIMWLCGDTSACTFLRDLDQGVVLGITSATASRERDPGLLMTRLRVALQILTLGYSVLLAEVGSLWLHDPWPLLAGPFDAVASPEERLGTGFGFPISPDLLAFHSTNTSINFVLELLRHHGVFSKCKGIGGECARKGDRTRYSAIVLKEMINNLLFIGMDARGKLIPGNAGAQIRRVEWRGLQLKTLDMELAPAPDVSFGWWRSVGRTVNTSGVVIRRGAPRSSIGAEASGKCVHSSAASDGARAMHPHQAIVSLVMLSHGHSQNIDGICHSLLPCVSNPKDRLIHHGMAHGGYAIQSVIVEDGSTDNSSQLWRLSLGHGDRAVRWLDTMGLRREAAIAFPASRGLADLLFFAPNQHEIRSYHQGFTMSWGDVLVTLQDDELYVQGDPTASRKWVADALRLLELHPKLSMISCNAGFLRRQGFDCNQYLPHYKQRCCYSNKNSSCWGETINPIPLFDPRLPLVPFMFVAGINFGPFIVRRKAYFDLGGFDTTWSNVGDPGIGYDTEFSLRAQAEGHLVGVMRCDGIRRRIGGGSSLANLAKRKLRFAMERRNNERLDRMYFNDESRMEQMIERAMQENRNKLSGSMPVLEKMESG